MSSFHTSYKKTPPMPQNTAHIYTAYIYI